MIMKFKTPRGSYGNRKYLEINTDTKTYTRLDPHIITEGIEIKSKDYSEIIEQLKTNNFIEV